MIWIDGRSPLPIYEQIVRRVEEGILLGLLEKDEKLPSVRALAGDLAINPNTIQKAYSLLEQDGIIYSRQGRGSFVALTGEALRAKKLPVLQDSFRQVVEKLRDLKVPEAHLIQEIGVLYHPESEEEAHD